MWPESLRAALEARQFKIDEPTVIGMSAELGNVMVFIDRDLATDGRLQLSIHHVFGSMYDCVLEPQPTNPEQAIAIIDAFLAGYRLRHVP